MWGQTSVIDNPKLINNLYSQSTGSAPTKSKIKSGQQNASGKNKREDDFAIENSDAEFEGAASCLVSMES